MRRPCTGAAVLALALASTGGCRDVTGTPRDEPRLLWRQPINTSKSPLGTPATDGARLYAILGGVAAFRASDGELLWKGGLETYAPENVIVGDGRVYAAEAAVSAFDSGSGQLRWRYRPDANSSLGRSLFHEGSVYFGTSSHRVYALDAATGARRWVRDVGPEWEHLGVVRGVAASGDTLYAAVEQWRAPNGYIASGWLIALNRHTGQIIWRFQSGSNNDRDVFGSTPTIAGRLVLASDVSSNAIVAVDRFTGQEVWRFRGLNGYVGFQEAPLVHGDRVFAGSGDTHVYALDLHTGRQVWRTGLPGANEAYVLCGDRLFVNYGGLAALDPATGQILWTGYDGDDEFTVSGFAVSENRIFVLGNKAAYAFRCS